MTDSKKGAGRTAGAAHELRRARDFSEQMARAVFGRHYWNDRLQQEMERSLTGRKIKPINGAPARKRPDRP